MVSRLFSTAGAFMSQVGEVLAPQVHSPLEDLRTHWKAIRKFYIDEKEDDIESFQASQLPEHLVSIGEILLEEEASLGDTGPCVEFFLQNKIFETLCALAERDSPRGVRKLVMQTMTMLLGDLSIPFLPNMSVHRPTRNLLRRLVLNTPSPSPSRKGVDTATPNYDSEFVSLLETLAKKCSADPSLVGFFVDDLEYPEGCFLIFQGLLKHLWNPGSIGERARKAMLICLQLPNMSRASSRKLEDAIAELQLEGAKQAGAADTPQQAQSPPTQQEPEQTPSTPQSTDQTQAQAAPDASTASNAKAPRMLVMINYEGFVTQQVTELLATFRGLPALVTSPTTQFSDFQVLDNCKNRVSFCCAVARVPQNDVGNLMTHVFEEKFLDSTLGPALLNPTEREVISATVYLREILPNFSSPLTDNLFKFLLGDFVGPEKRDDADVHLLRSTLISRINSPSDNLSLATCRLFSTMIGLHNYHVLYNLLLRSFTVPIPSTSQSNIYATSPISASSISASEFEHLQPSIARFLTLFGNKFTATPHHADASNNSGETSRYDVYLVDSQHQLVLFKAACQDWPCNYQAPTQPIAYIGSFLEQLFTKLGKSLDQTLDANLVITGILSKLCYYPITPLSLVLLCHSPNVAPSNPTLYNTLEKMLEEIENRAKKFVNIGVCIDRARNMMAEDNYDHSNGKIPNIELTFNPRRYLQAVIVLEEFCKELAATLQAKLVNSKTVG